MEKSLLTEVKAILKSLVLSCPDKITIEQLNRDYRDVEGTFIPFRQLGYGNLEQFLRSVTDTLQVFGSGPTAMVCFVPNEKSVHIHDMIMRQKKPKSKARSGPKRSFRNGGNAFRENSLPKPATRRGQQLSPYQSVNRNQMTKTLQVRLTPQVTQMNNYGSISFANQMLQNLPQPNGILTNPFLSTIKNGIITNISGQLYQNQVNHVANLLKTQCNVTNSAPPPLPRQQNKSSYFSTKKKSLQADAKVKIPQKEFNNIDRSLEEIETTSSLIQIKPPTSKKYLSIKFSEDEEDISTMPKLKKVLNLIEEPSQDVENILTMPKLSEDINSIVEPSVDESQQVDDIQNNKTNGSIQRIKPRRFFDDSTDIFQDPDEAIPSFAAKNNVFRLDFPEHTVPYGNKITHYKLPDDIVVGSILKIFVTEIHSPFKFWFHIFKSNHEVDLLMHQLERYYSNLDSEDLRIPPACLIPGQICAACYEGMWHRAEIVAPPVNKHIKVSFMDYGTVTEVEIENVKFLATYFGELPAQAIRGCLSNIKPIEYHWSHEATLHFLYLVKELMLYAKVTEIDKKERVLYMILCDTNGKNVVQINSSLVESGYAFYNEDWKSETIQQNSGKRLHHPCEDFPT